MIMFLKNMAMAGGFLVLAETAIEAEAWSSQLQNGELGLPSRFRVETPVLNGTDSIKQRNHNAGHPDGVSGQSLVVWRFAG